MLLADSHAFLCYSPIVVIDGDAGHPFLTGAAAKHLQLVQWGVALDELVSRSSSENYYRQQQQIELGNIAPAFEHCGGLWWT
jgi:hypothetical protein